MSKKVELTGKKFGKIITLKDSGKRNICGNVIWKCKCECGNIKEIDSHSLLNGNTKSCGCSTNLKHGHTSNKGKNSKTYYCWASMKSRCLNKNHVRYKNYGGRGISICKEWLLFENFLSDMGEKPDGLSIDRINNNGNYKSSNCKWSTPKEQANNKRR